MKKENPEMKQIGKLINSRRQELGWSLRELSRQAGVSAAHLSCIERGIRVPSIPVATVVAETLDLPVELIASASARLYRPAAGRHPLQPSTEGSHSRGQILLFINEFYAEKGYMPSIREIGDALSVSSTSVVNYALNQMQRWGWISRSHVARGIHLPGVDNLQSINQELARLRQVIIQADPELEGVQLVELMGSPQKVIEYATKLLQTNLVCTIDRD